MTFDSDRLLNCKTHYNPFPILEINDFLNKEEAELACKILDDTNFDETNMVNRKNVRKGTKNFDYFIEKNKFFSDLFAFFNDENQYKYLFEKLSAISSNSDLKFEIVDKPDSFKNDYYAYKNTVHKNKISKKIWNFFIKKFPKIFDKYFSFTFLDMIFAEAGAGYRLETHTDKPTRVIVFLLYLNDLKDDEGGSLEVYSNNNEKNELIVHSKFKPKAGKLIVFLSNPVSFHNVEAIKKESTSRKFVYGSYTCGRNIVWKKY